MFIKTSTIDFLLIIKFEEGSLDLDNVPETSDLIDNIFNDNNSIIKDIVLDFRNIETIDSSGVGLLIHLRQSINKFKHKLYIININDSVIKILELTKLKTFFEIYKNYEELSKCLKKS